MQCMLAVCAGSSVLVAQNLRQFFVVELFDISEHFLLVLSIFTNVGNCGITLPVLNGEKKRCIFW